MNIPTKFVGRGTGISEAEVTNISANGFWLLLDDREIFLAFDDFPWFREARVREICRVQRPQPGHLQWPDLDVDLAIECLAEPSRFPLVSRV